MSSEKSIDEICINSEHPLASNIMALKELKEIELKSKYDAVSYARGLWKIYSKVVPYNNGNKSGRKEIVRTLQHVLGNENVDINANSGLVILNTESGNYGFHLGDNKMHMKKVNSIWTPLGTYHKLKGKPYHVDRIIYPVSSMGK